MTTVELRTSIVAELDQMSVEMLESVQHYVRRLRCNKGRSQSRDERIHPESDALQAWQPLVCHRRGSGSPALRIPN